MHYVGDFDLFMFFNESLTETIDVNVDLPVKGEACFYDAWHNKTYACDLTQTASGSQVRIVLEPYESILVAYGKTGTDSLPAALASMAPIKQIDGPWTVSFATALEYPAFGEAQQMDNLVDLAIENPLFSGIARYEQVVKLDEQPDPETELVIEEANEAVEVWVNDQYAGMRICPPYRFAVGEHLKTGENTLRIEVTNTLANQMKPHTNPMFEKFIPPTMQAPDGLSGKIELRR